MISSTTGRSAGHRSRERVSRRASWFVPRVSLLQRGGVDFSRFVLRSHQKEIKLVGLQLLTRAAEHAPNEQVHLLTEQFDFLTKTSILFSQLLILSKKLLFAQFLHCLY